MSELQFKVKRHITYTKTVEGVKKYFYYSEVECITCGYLKQIYKNDIRHMRECKMCNIQKHRTDFIGFENEFYKVINFSHEKRRKLFYTVLCKRCNSIVTMRKDAITDVNKCSCINCKSNGIKPSMKSPLNVYMYYYMHGAKSRNLEWTLESEEFFHLIKQNCFYCGEPPILLQSLKRYVKVKDTVLVNGIDRKDSIKGYTLENCVPCCKICNQMKMSLDNLEFINHALKIVNHSVKFNDYPEREYSIS